MRFSPLRDKIVKALQTLRTGSVHGSSLYVFRMLFGLIMTVSAVRFMAHGWIDVLYGEPTFFFKYDGFHWVSVWPLWGMWLHYGVIALSAACVALGLFYRVSIAAFTLSFAWVQLMDVTNYLNHYYLIVLLGALLSFMPAADGWSLDAWRKGRGSRLHVPAWCLWLLRGQIACVYFYAGLAKLGSDWLIHGQPLDIWMHARTELPVIGSFIALPWVTLAMSWAGFLYDTTIVGWLLWRRSRPFAFALVLCFHTLTFVFFDIGVFPFVMTAAATLFFAPSWSQRLVGGARRLFGRERSGALPVREWTASPKPLVRGALVVMGLYLAVQWTLPLRHFFYDGDVLWNERGMRFAWKVMVREKNGSITYHVRRKEDGRHWLVSMHDYLTWRQANEASGQPDLIIQLAQRIARDFKARGLGDVEVRAEARVSLNGRAPQLMLNPEVNLVGLQTPWWQHRAVWETPQPSIGPPALAMGGD